MAGLRPATRRHCERSEAISATNESVVEIALSASAPRNDGADAHENRAMAKPRYYVTTAIAYPNGVPHIGHAYEAIATDAIARFMRLEGYDVLFLTGTDEHGMKMLQTATKEKLAPGELLERNVPRFP